MAWTNPLFLLPAIIGITVVVASVIMRKYPPRQINYLYGYRTTRSMLSQERWDFAQKFAAKAFLKWGIILTSISLVGLAVDVSNGLGLAIGLGVGIALIAIPWLLTEKALKNRFGEAEARS